MNIDRKLDLLNADPSFGAAIFDYGSVVDNGSEYGLWLKRDGYVAVFSSDPDNLRPNEDTVLEIFGPVDLIGRFIMQISQMSEIAIPGLPKILELAKEAATEEFELFGELQ